MVTPLISPLFGIALIYILFLIIFFIIIIFLVGAPVIGLALSTRHPKLGIAIAISMTVIGTLIMLSRLSIEAVRLSPLSDLIFWLGIWDVSIAILTALLSVRSVRHPKRAKAVVPPQEAASEDKPRKKTLFQKNRPYNA